jgi:glycosyltransferase involved in cell wall biosynthesis
VSIEQPAILRRPAVPLGGPRGADPADPHAGSISVIIPALNEEKLIGATLDLFPPELCAKHGIEVIVSDGGSTDRTMELARERGAAVVEHTGSHRQTIAEGRNAGAERSRGDVLVFLNADTLIPDPDRFFTIISEQLKGATADALACPVEIVPSERRGFDSVFSAVYNGYVAALNASGVGMGRGECHIVRRAAFERVGRYNAAMTAGEDFDLYRRLRRFGPIRYVRELTVWESPRRFRKFGYARVLWDWNRNALSVIFFNRSVSKEWDPVR